MKRKLNIKRLIIAVVVLMLIIIMFIISLFFFMLSPVEKNKEDISYVIETGTTPYDVFKDLKENELIRNDFFLKIYSVLVGGVEIDAGTYILNDKMSSIEIFEYLSGKNYQNHEQIVLTFKEGFNINKLIGIVTEKTDITEEMIREKLDDEEYLNSLINEYWFLTNDILSENIYYSLEGFLFPNTYYINKDGNIEELFRVMLNETDRVLSKYKDKITEDYSIFELMTLASVVELEAAKSEDRVLVAGVFWNRLKNNESLGSCVTTYYAVGKSMSEDLYQADLNSTSLYNTRNVNLNIILPIGPISNPGEESIDATFNPTQTDYYYFVNDIYGKLHFTKTLNEHNNKIRELSNEGIY